MKRLSIAVATALGLTTAAQATSPILGAYVTDSYEHCMDRVYASCLGSYGTGAYAMCT